MSPAGAAPAYRIDEQPASASAFYAAACDPRRSVVVEACAGAGKTWMLVSRILRALLAGAEPAQILAITFTRKAAAEMRSRLDEWLAEFADVRCSQPERVHALQQRGLTEGQAQALAAALGGLHERVLRGGRSVEVRTFHGWFAQLLAHAPLSLLQTLGLPVAYELIEDPAALHDELFRGFHRSVQASAPLRADYLELVRRHRRSTTLQWLAAAWQRAAELRLADAAGTLEDSVPPAAAVWSECIGLANPCLLLQRAPLRDDIEALAGQLGAAGKATPEKAARGLCAALEEADPQTAFALAWAALFTKTGEPLKRLGDSALQRAVVEALQRLQAQQRQQSAHEDHHRMLRLSRALLAEYVALKWRRSLVDMPDLERAAQALLADHELAGWVQERLDQRLRHLLIDEFQDTSPLQWQALHGWLSAYAGAGGGASGQRPLAVFIVGDPKQSIYRFRNAEPRVFVAAREFVTEGLGGQVLQCDHTRRNAPAVVDALNAVFSEAARLEGWGPFRAHTTGAGGTGGVGAVRRLTGVQRPPRSRAAQADGVWRDSLTQPRQEPETRLRAEEAQQAADAVAELVHRHGLRPGEVMVLARKRAMLSLVADALARRGLPHAVAEPLALQHSPEALDLLAVLDVLASPGHDISLARALKSPLFGAGDADLLWLAQVAAQSAGQSARPWLEVLLGTAALPSAALQRARSLMAGWAMVARNLPPHDLLDRIVHQGDLPGRLMAAVPAARRAAAVQAVHALLAAALEHGGGRFATPYGLVRELLAGRVRAASTVPAEAVQLLTVHGAKGLEARAVVVVDADAEPRAPERATLLIDWPVQASAPQRVAFLRSEAEMAPSLAELWADELAARAREELNGLYVAMTRARQWLVFSRTEPRAANVGSWWQRVRGQAAAWLPETAGAIDAPGAAAAVDVVHVPQLPGLSWQAAALPRSAAGDAAAARVGQAVHRVLEWAGRPDAPLPRTALPAASQAAAAAFGVPANDVVRVQAAAVAVLDSPACARFFTGAALRWAGNEVPIAFEGQVLRIDRLVALDENLEPGTAGITWWVLDYKLQSRPGAVAEYRQQMQRYVAAVQAAQPGARVRAAFITGSGRLVERLS